jgi:hypothetical protein
MMLSCGGCNWDTCNSSVAEISTTAAHAAGRVHSRRRE